jgi:hypothetical protein
LAAVANIYRKCTGTQLPVPLFQGEVVDAWLLAAITNMAMNRENVPVLNGLLFKDG